jgi:hypothetical protein
MTSLLTSQQTQQPLSAELENTLDELLSLAAGKESPALARACQVYRLAILGAKVKEMYHHKEPAFGDQWDGDVSRLIWEEGE